MSRIIITIVYLAFYIVWVRGNIFSSLYFFAFELIMVGIVLKSHFYFKKNTKKLRELHKDVIPDEIYWKILNKYGVAIYTPSGAESIAVSFTFNRF